ncbi:hypothetical protein [Candidatus Methanarcanum hacksteinii]|uniref:hypothetical protein n=1 Tax=Candidatus Methanarcanum hacksteinii TaxID=2911857 RepID=UPI0037DC083C
MSEAKKYTFEEFCQTVGAIVAEYGILGVYLFGSGACVDNRPDSDYNFRIKIPKGLGLSIWAESEDARILRLPFGS